MSHKFSDLPNVDTLIAMAKEDPEGLETLREKLFHELVDNATTEKRKRRLHGTQFIINMHLQKVKTPLAACIKLSELMWESTLEMNDKMQLLRKHPGGY